MNLMGKEAGPLRSPLCEIEEAHAEMLKQELIHFTEQRLRKRQRFQLKFKMCIRDRYKGKIAVEIQNMI